VLALQGLSTESQPSAKMMVTLIELIKKTGVTTLFLENITNPTLLQQVSQETKATLKGPIYSDALSEPQDPAATFLNLMQYNVGLFYDSMIQIPKS
jgi:zinc/manganese transport system substrate-binding protein